MIHNQGSPKNLTHYNYLDFMNNDIPKTATFCVYLCQILALMIHLMQNHNTIAINSHLLLLRNSTIVGKWMIILINFHDLNQNLTYLYSAATQVFPM